LLATQQFGGLVQPIQEFLSDFHGKKWNKIAEFLEPSKVRLFWQRFFLFEAWHSIAKTHKKYNFCFPEFTGGEFAITGLYHPLLKQPVKNSIEKAHHVVLLTGPNMSGKSTLLKSMGLCVYLGHLGFGVPASSCRIPFFDTICIAINLKDDLKSGYSHFLSEIKTLKEVVTEAADNKRCFAVFDELFRGTNLEDALEISTTTIQGLTKFRHSLFFISTHLHQLKELVDLHNIDTHYIECHIKNNQPVFTYQLKTGWSDVKIGRLLFEQEGLNRLLNV
jgi:DNA mismatch repair protein MutS